MTKNTIVYKTYSMPSQTAERLDELANRTRKKKSNLVTLAIERLILAYISDQTILEDRDERDTTGSA